MSYLVLVQYIEEEKVNFSLCCKFHEEKIPFKIYTLKNIQSLSISDAREKIYKVVLHNISSLQQAFDYCYKNDILGFRIASDIIPHHTNLLDLGILKKEDIDFFAEKLRGLDTKNLILSMHPGQFVNMGSPKIEVVENSVKEIREHLFIANSLKFGDINFHLGGTYENKELTMERFVDNMNKYFSETELKKMTLENDEFNYSIEDVVKVCKILRIPAVFDIHHQRVYNNKFNLGHEKLEEQFLLSRETWDRIAWQRIHISSPKNGFENIKDSRAHADYINLSDIPEFLLGYSDVLVDVEAKYKELAVIKLKNEINNIKAPKI